jgi:hypothetical protein
LTTRPCPGASDIPQQPQDGFPLLYRPLPGEVDVIDTPDKAFNVRRQYDTVNKLQKRLSGQPPFSDKILYRCSEPATPVLRPAAQEQDCEGDSRTYARNDAPVAHQA